MSRFQPPWMNASKKWGETFFIRFSVVWVLLFGIVVVTEVYKEWEDFGFMMIGLVVSVPFVLFPFLFPGDPDRSLPYSQRYWVKANVWVAIFSYVGNYFYTHYFYKVLGAAYSFPVVIQLNEVPFFLYLITHAYFMSYFTFSTLGIRLLRTSSYYSKMGTTGRFISNIGLIFVMSVITAFMETFTIQTVPYYTHESKEFMYTVGSLFYGWYFYVAFPMFYLIDENPKEVWSVRDAAMNCLASCMIVLIFLDLTRIILIAFGITINSTTPFL